jgi:Protein of unknown function (DUF2934)
MEDNPNPAKESERAGTETDSPTEDSAREKVTWERIAERAYLISQSEDAGSAEENWLRAERELLEELERRQR